VVLIVTNTLIIITSYDKAFS